MKEYPILFTSEMVKAIPEGRKSQTRRTKRLKKINEHPDWYARAYEDGGGNWIFWYPDTPGLAEFTKKAYPAAEGFACPYGVPGDRLWVKEALRKFTTQADEHAQYVADCTGVPYREGCPKGYCGRAGWVWKRDVLPSIHMPRWASRLTLEVVKVRVERVQDITEEDAIKEGVGHGFACNAGWPDYQHIRDGVCELTHDSARMSYATLWDSLNAKRGYSWESNPWVWVIEFKRMEGKP